MSAPQLLRDRAYLVAGPAKGMGRAISVAIAQGGGDLLLAGRDTDAIEPVAEEVRRLGRRAVHPTDVTRDEDVAAACAAWQENFAGHLGGAVFVAGGFGPVGAKLWEHTADDFHAVFDVNVLGVFLAMRHVLPALNETGTGSVVTIGGTFGFKGVPDASLYAATKWALRGINRTAALEAGPHGVRVNMFNPGGVDGPRTERSFAREAEMKGTTYQAVYDAFAAGTALGRLSLDTDIADAVMFLLSDHARNITGQDLIVDGGTIV